MVAYHFRPGVYLEVPVIIFIIILLLGLTLAMPNAGWLGAMLAIVIYLLVFFVFGAFTVYSLTVDEGGIRQYTEGRWLKYLTTKAPFQCAYTHIRYVELVEHSFRQQELRIVALDYQYCTVRSCVYPEFSQMVAAISQYVPVQRRP